jgi:hypothetical protein
MPMPAGFIFNGFGFLDSTKWTFSGAYTKSIDCVNYTTAEAIEADYELYANSAVATAADAQRWLIPVFFGVFIECIIWLMNLWMMNYFNAMNDIIQCGQTNAVDSKYGLDFFNASFSGAYNDLMD